MTSQSNSVLSDHLLTVAEVARIHRVSKRTIWRWVANKRFPEPIRYSKKCVRWKATEIQAYLATLTTASH